MARKTNIQLRRSATAGAIPSTSALDLGEIALNTYDGKAYMKKSVSGTDSVVQIGSSEAASADILKTYEYDGSDGSGSNTIFSGADNNSETLAYSAGAIQVYLNGVLLKDTTDYTASNGNSVTLVNSAAAADVLQIVAWFKAIGTGDNAIQQLSGDNSTTGFTLATNPYHENQTDIFIDGIYQQKTTYSISGTTLTFSEAPPTGTNNIEISTKSTNLDTGSLSSATFSGTVTANAFAGNLTGNVTGNTSGSAGTVTSIAAHDTDDLSEGSTNLYHTSERVDDRVNALITAGANISKTYDDAAGTLTLVGTDTNTLPSAGTGISVSTATVSLSHLGLEALADPDADRIFFWDDSAGAAKFLSLGTGLSISGTVLSGAALYADSDARAAISVTDAGGDGSLAYNSSTGVITYTGPSAAEVRAHISVTDSGGDGSLAYSNGVITYTGPSAAEVRAHLSAGTGVTYSSGAISIGQAVATSSNVTFADLAATGNVVITGNLTVNGTQTTLSTATLSVEDLNITVGSGATTSSATNGAGLTFGAWSSGTIPTLTWDHSNARFAMNKSLAANIVGNVTGNVTGNTSGSSGSTTGNAATATALATARTIGGVSFDGTANINLPGVNASGTQDTSGNAATATTAGTVTTAAQTNITSLGSLTGLDVNGAVTINDNLSLDGSNKELRFYEGSNYVGFEAPALSADQIWVLPNADGSSGTALKTDGSGNLSWGTAGGNAFETIAVSGQSNVVADSTTDTLTFAAGTGITLTTNASSDTVTITNSSTGGNSFGNVAVSGQTTVAADAATDTLTLVAGTGVTLTTDASADSVTITNDYVINPMVTDLFTTANGSTTAYTLTGTANSEDSLIVFIEGVYQNKNSYVYNVTTKVLTLDSAPPSGVEVVATQIGKGVAGTGHTQNAFTGNGSTAAYTLGVTPVTENDVFVYLDGVYQHKNTFTVSGTTLTFDTNVPNGVAIEAIIPSVTEIGVPTNASVTPAKLSTGGPSWDSDGNVTINSNVVKGSDSVTISSGSATAVATMAASTYRSVKITAQVTDATASEYMVTEVLLIHTGSATHITEYGQIHTGSAALGTFTADYDSGNMRLLYTRTGSNSQVVKVDISRLKV